MDQSDFARALQDHLQRAVADRYTISRQLPGGGMSVVFLADEHALNRKVVIKVLARELAGPDAIDRFRREIAMLATIQHPQIVPLLAAGDVDGLPWFAMPFVDGPSLRSRIARGPLSVREAVSILVDVSRALSFAHDHGVVHRDIKPDNILLPAGSAVVADFGVAKAIAGTGRRPLAPNATPPSRDITVEGTSLGTPAYMAPEQVVGDPNADHRADLYALGIIAYEMFAGTPPFRDPLPHRVLAAQMTDTPQPISRHRNDVPAGIEHMVMRCLEKDPARRPASALEVLRTLQDPEILGGQPHSPASQQRAVAASAPTALGRLLNRVAVFTTDLRVAVRSLRRAPTVTVSAVLCLGLGLGVTAAISSAVDRALLQPLPFRNPDRLVTVYRTTPHFNTGPFSAPNYTDLAASSRQLEALAALGSGSALLTLPDHSVEVTSERVTGNLLPMLGVTALRGRLLGPDDDLPNRPAVVMLSEESWRALFGADESLIGGTVVLDGQATTVAGVLPAGFRVPHGGQVIRADVWTPMRFSASEMAQRRSNFVLTLGRLAARATPEQAQAELIAGFDRLVQSYTQLRGESVRVLPLQAEAVRGVRGPLLLLFGAVCLILLIATANVASLLLARGVQRQREMAIRTALGASQWAVIRPVLAESVVLTVAGVAVGLTLAWVGVRAIGTLAAQRMPQLIGLTVDMRVIIFALALSGVVAALCALAPAWRGTRADPQDALRGGRGGGTGRGHQRVLAMLVVGEVGISLTLLLCGGLVFKGFTHLLSNDPGFDPAPLLTLEARISPQNYADGTAVERFLEPALAAIKAIPGVESAAAISLLPYRNWGWNFNVWYEGQPGDDPTKLPLVENRTITPGFFDVTRQRLLSGRGLRESDDRSPKAGVVVVANEALVKRDFPGQDPIGKRFRTGDTTFATIVGVVTNIRNFGPVSPAQPEVYWPYRQSSPGASGFGLMVRMKQGNPTVMTTQVVAALRSIDKGVAVTQVMPMTDIIAASVGQPRFFLSLMAAFAGVAIALAVAGLYGVMSYAVAQRTRELGIRSALGSTPGVTIRLVARQGMSLVAVGTLLGLAAGAGVTRLLVNMLYGVSPLDLPTWATAVAAMIVAGLGATLVPSFRATRVDPLVAIRAE